VLNIRQLPVEAIFKCLGLIGTDIQSSYETRKLFELRLLTLAVANRALLIITLFFAASIVSFLVGKRFYD